MRSFDDVTRESRLPAGGYCLLDTLDARVRLAAMTTMASTLAHEVSQPLTAATNYIHACASRLRGQGEGNEDLIAMIEQAARETLKAGDIIRRMRSFIVSGKVKGSREDLAKMIDSASELLACPDGAEVEIVKTIQPDAAFVIADRVQIEQILSIILSNACEALDGRGVRRISIGATRLDDQVVVRIEDSGPGLTDYALARLFEPLFTTKSAGMGLGMPICKAIVEAHGGRLWAENLEAGGAAFSVSLPVA